VSVRENRVKIHGNARACPRSRSLVVRRVEQGWTLSETAAAAGVSVRMVSKWLRCYRLEGEQGLLDRSLAPHRIPHRTAELPRVCRE
jgi:transposase-like protein